MIVYQAAMIRPCYQVRLDYNTSSSRYKLLIVFLQLDYVDQQDGISTHSHGQAQVQNNTSSASPPSTSSLALKYVVDLDVHRS